MTAGQGRTEAVCGQGRQPGGLWGGRRRGRMSGPGSGPRRDRQARDRQARDRQALRSAAALPLPRAGSGVSVDARYTRQYMY